MSYSKDNKWYKLRGRCFVCNNGDDYDGWEHSGNCSGHLYINDKCEVSCDKCKNPPNFIMNCTFKCRNHALAKPNIRFVIVAISSMAKNEDIPKEVFKSMNRILLDSM